MGSILAMLIGCCLTSREQYVRWIYWMIDVEHQEDSIVFQFYSWRKHDLKKYKSNRLKDVTKMGQWVEYLDCHRRQWPKENEWKDKLWPTTYYTENYDPQHTTQKTMTHNILHRKLWPTTYYTENYDPQQTTQTTMTHNILHRN